MITNRPYEVDTTMETPPDRDDYLTPKELAATLGVHVKTVRRWIQDGRFEAVKIGTQTIRISRDVLRRLIVSDRDRKR